MGDTRKRPTVSAVIPAYNSEGFISDAIESIFAQTVEVDEIIVVDDGSSDRTADVAASHPRTRVIKRQNGGQGAARNTGVNAASSEWIAFLDHDDLWSPKKTELQLKYVSEDCAVIHCERFETIHFGKLWHRQAHLAPSGTMVRRQALLDVGGFDEDRSVVGVEDLNLWLNIAKSGWRFAQSEPNLFTWRFMGANFSRNEVKMVNAELATLDLVGSRIGCDPEEVERLKQASRVEYAKNLIAEKRWSDAGQLLHDCRPGVASRWLSLAQFLKINRMARSSLVKWMEDIDEGSGSHVCTGSCSLPEVQRSQCMKSSSMPYYRPTEATTPPVPDAELSSVGH